ncbi:MAG: HAD-IC family P-type ATPase, partial [Bacilli bacterium]
MKKREILEKLNIDPKIGLNDQLAREIRLESGFNELEEAKRTPLFIKFLSQFKDILIIILIIAAILPLIIDPHDFIESIIIMVVVIVNAVLGTYQENKAEKSLEALKKMSTPLAKVKRDGQVFQIESRLLVPGDVIEIEAGDFIPADCLILSQSNLNVDESALTGESVSVNKTSDDIEEEENLSLGDRKNMLYSSTYATYGKGEAIVVKTGMNTEIGKIAKMLSAPKESLTPLQVKLNQIGKTIGIIAISICALVFVFEIIAAARLLETSIFDIGSSSFFKAFKS